MSKSSIANETLRLLFAFPRYCFIAAYFKGRCAPYFLKLLSLFLIVIIAMKCIRTRYLPHPVLSVSQSVSAA